MKPRVLIVDDEKDLRELLAEEVGSLGFDVLTAADGREALRYLDGGSTVDCILSDINMPNLSGLDLIAQIRAEGIETPLIFLTGYGDKEKAITALRFGAFDFLEKPCDGEKLLSTVKKATLFGFSLRSLDAEVEARCARSGRIGADRERYRLQQRAILLMQKKTAALNKAA